jgi:integrase
MPREHFKGERRDKLRAPFPIPALGLLRSSGLSLPGPGWGFHDLRHSAASLAISQGEYVKVVQGMLGHSSASVTLDTYSHAFSALSEQLTGGLEAAYRDSLTAQRRHAGPFARR